MVQQDKHECRAWVEESNVGGEKFPTLLGLPTLSKQTA